MDPSLTHTHRGQRHWAHTLSWYHLSPLASEAHQLSGRAGKKQEWRGRCTGASRSGWVTQPKHECTRAFTARSACEPEWITDAEVTASAQVWYHSLFSTVVIPHFPTYTDTELARQHQQPSLTYLDPWPPLIMAVPRAPGPHTSIPAPVFSAATQLG